MTTPAQPVDLPEPDVHIAAGKWEAVVDCNYYTAERVRAAIASAVAPWRDALQAVVTSYERDQYRSWEKGSPDWHKSISAAQALLSGAVPRPTEAPSTVKMTESEFCDWFGRNYYGDVVFSDSDWHAKSIYKRLIRSSPVASAPRPMAQGEPSDNLVKIAGAMRADALEVFDGPECPQEVRDAIEYCYGVLCAVKARGDAASAVPSGGKGGASERELMLAAFDTWGRAQGVGHAVEPKHFPNSFPKFEAGWMARAALSTTPAPDGYASWQEWANNPPNPIQPSTVQELSDLHKFYNVSTDADLIEAQARHIEKLQAKLPRNDQPAFTRVREG